MEIFSVLLFTDYTAIGSVLISTLILMVVVAVLSSMDRFNEEHYGDVEAKERKSYRIDVILHSK